MVSHEDDERLYEFLLDERTRGNLESTTLCFKTKMKLVLRWLEEKRKPEQMRIGSQNLANECSVHVTKRQVNNYIRDRHRLCETYIEGRDKRVAGGGRPASTKDVEAEAAKTMKERIEIGRPLTRCEAMVLLGTTSVGVYERFLDRHGLRERTTEIEISSLKETIERELQQFHARVKFIAKSMGDTFSDNVIVQFDEIALTMSGSMHKKQKFVGYPNKSMITEKCPLRSGKKVATGVFFLSTTVIPPLLLFKGSRGFEDRKAKHPSIHYTENANMTEECFCNVILPHIRTHAPNCLVIVFDSATSHTTPKCREAVSSQGIWDLVIPANCTSMVQALDVYYFAVYRSTQTGVVNKLIATNGQDMYKRMSASDSRMLMAEIVQKTFECIKVDVRAMFRNLGYVDPSAGVLLPHLPDYKFDESLVSEEWLRNQRRPEQIVAVDNEKIEEVVVELAALPIEGPRESGSRKRARTVLPCDCGHGTQPGRHKRSCSRHKPDKKNDEIKEPQMSVLELLKSCSLASLVPATLHDYSDLDTSESESESDVVIDDDVVVFPDGDVVEFTFERRQSVDALWEKYENGSFISTRTIEAVLTEVRDLFPGDVVVDPLGLTALLARPGRAQGMKLCAIAFHSNHYVVFGYCPFTKRFTSYDSLDGYYENERRKLGDKIAQWLEESGNEIMSKRRACPGVLQAEGSNDCGIFALNFALHFLSGGQMGVLSRPQFRLKYDNPSYAFKYFEYNPQRPIPLISDTKCECGINLREMVSKASGNRFWGCPNTQCVAEKSGPWRKAWSI